MKNLRPLILTLILVLSSPIVYAAPVNYLITPNKTELIFLGTSTLHAFHGDCKSFKGELQFTEKPQSAPDISGRVVVDVNMMTTGNKTMDLKMFQMLQNDQFPIIVYEIQKFIPTTKTLTEESIPGKLIGQLTIRKITLPIECEVVVRKTVRGEYDLEGKSKLSLIEFQMKPPTVLKILNVHDPVGIIFTATLEPNLQKP
ncbi:MAG: YceI family protein [Candidatus Omnitrophica bacterium]|nr:YceI family protein [Candidatus Omnitrophota bacterium]